MARTFLTVFGLLAVSTYLALADPSAETLCSDVTSQLSCGQCIKAHTDCAWCIDPHSPLANRCQLKTKFTNETCTPHLVYSPQAAQVKIQQDLPLEAKQHDQKTIVRLQPQATSVRLMPGNSASVSFKYLHKSDPNRRSTEPEKMEIQTSDIRDTPISLKFFIVCEGSEQETKSCKVQNNQIVEFRVEVFANACSTTGDITLSIGVLGQRTIAGLYVTTVCGCECEKHPEMNSRLCHQYGHLVCGQCVCDATRGGDKCDCPLALHGVSTAAALEDKCRFNSSSLVCSGSGKCNCGQCQCAKNTVSGKFCQCDNTACPTSADGKLCSGNGVCDCGVCKCELGWERDDCSCSSANNNCIENGPAETITEAPAADDEAEQPTEEPTIESPEAEATEAASDVETTVPSDEELAKELDDSEKQVSGSFANGFILPIFAAIILIF